MFEKNDDGQVPETFPTNTTEDHPQLPSADETSAAKLTEVERTGTPSNRKPSEGGSEASGTLMSSNLTTKNETGELNTTTTNVQSLQKEGDPSARRGPTGPRSERGKQESSRNAI